MVSEIHINNASFGQPSNETTGLVVEITTDTISFAEFNFEERKPLFVCHYPIDATSALTLSEHTISAIKHFQVTKKNHTTVYINYFTEQFTLCPLPFFDSDSTRALLEFNVGSVDNKLVLVDDLNSDIKLIYAVDDNLKSTLDTIFPNHQLKHTQTISSKLLLQSEELHKDDILLSIHHNYIEIIYKREQKLILANQFPIKTQEDVLYYVLFVLEQYQLNPLFVSIVIVGNIESSSPLITSLKKYIKHIRLALGHKSISWQSVSGMPQHFNYTLLNRLFCEL